MQHWLLSWTVLTEGVYSSGFTKVFQVSSTLRTLAVFKKNERKGNGKKINQNRSAT